MNRTFRFSVLALSALSTMTACSQQKDTIAEGAPAASAVSNATADASAIDSIVQQTSCTMDVDIGHSLK